MQVPHLVLVDESGDEVGDGRRVVIDDEVRVARAARPHVRVVTQRRDETLLQLRVRRVPAQLTLLQRDKVCVCVCVFVCVCVCVCVCAFVSLGSFSTTAFRSHKTYT